MRSDWAPLEQMLGSKLCESFMFMGRSGEIYLYKHIDTRRYLNLDAEGNAFATQGTNMSQKSVQRPLRTSSANGKSRLHDDGAGKGRRTP